MTPAQARRQRAQLMREIAREHKRGDRARLVALRDRLRASRTARVAAIRRAREACRRRGKVPTLKEAAAMLRAARIAARRQCDVDLAAAAKLKDETARARAELEAERKHQRAMKRIERGNVARAAEEKRASARTRRGESDDEVRGNIPPELVHLFERVKRQIKGSERMTRTEAFLHYAAEHPDEEIAALEDRTDEIIRQLEARERGEPMARRNPEGDLVGFGAWRDVLEYARTGGPLYYKAPMDHRATRLYPGKRREAGYDVRARSIRVWPYGSIGRGARRTADPFTANAGHLDRFFRSASSNPKKRGPRQTGAQGSLFVPVSGQLEIVPSHEQTQIVKQAKLSAEARTVPMFKNPKKSKGSKASSPCEAELRAKVSRLQAELRESKRAKKKKRNPRRPPSRWWQDCLSSVAAQHHAKDPAAVCGATWWRLPPARRAAIVRRLEHGSPRDRRRAVALARAERNRHDRSRRKARKPKRAKRSKRKRNPPAYAVAYIEQKPGDARPHVYEHVFAKPRPELRIKGRDVTIVRKNSRYTTRDGWIYG